MLYVAPNQPTSKIQFKSRYGNFIGGNWIAPVKGEYFDNLSPVNGEVFCQIPRSSAEDMELALDAAHAAREAWGKTSVTARLRILINLNTDSGRT